MRAPYRVVVAAFALAFGLSGCIGSEQEPTSPQTPGSFASLVTPGTPRWRALAEAPEPRQEVAAALLDGKVYVVGGLTASGATNRVDIYDVAADTWADGPPLPVALHHAMAAAFGGAIVVIGGFDAQSRPVDSVFRLSGGAWVEDRPLRRPRAAGAAIVEGSRLFVLGGQGAGSLVAPVEELVAGTWVDRAAIPTPRHHVAAASDGTWIYVSGGRTPAGGSGPDRNVAAFERFNIAENRWVQAPPVPTARSGHGSGFIDGSVIVTGGEDPAAGSGQPSIASTERYDPAKGVWLKDLPGMFRARHGVGAVTIEGKLYLFLGGSRVALAPTADSDVFVIP
ncbi:MAG TPA: kelch repeat-containing protein [Actinomycetota bacterium]